MRRQLLELVIVSYRGAMNRERTVRVAAVLAVVGLALMGGAWWYYGWQQSEADQAEFSNEFMTSVSEGMLSGSAEPPATWPAAALGVAGLVVLLGAGGLAVAVYVTSPQNEPT